MFGSLSFACPPPKIFHVISNDNYERTFLFVQTLDGKDEEELQG